MQILSAEQIKAWDQYTILHEPIASIDLMERAATACIQWIEKKPWRQKHFYIFCGKGNNGGDGLAIARMLIQKDFHVSVFILETGKTGSPDFEKNFQRLQALASGELHFIDSHEKLLAINEEAIVVDALYGSGLNKPLDGLAVTLIEHINKSKATVISIDLPSGLFISQSSIGNAVIQADFTLSFQCYKLGLLVQENAAFIGEVNILNIGLHQDFLKDLFTPYYLTDEIIIKKIFKPRTAFSHKGSFGHALLIGGSYGKMGAMVLSANACLSSGAGLTTCLIPACGYHIMQTSTPEAMVIVDEAEKHLATLPAELEKFTVIGIGPGMGTEPETRNLLSFIIRRSNKSLVIDADGLNCLSLQSELITHLPPYSILTPHPKEFDRLFGEHKNDFDRIEKAKQKAAAYKIVIVLKSHHTLIALPDGRCCFNSTGNVGMAKGGSGDVLMGIITSLLAQKYTSEEAAILGVYLHGRAGDVAAKKYSKQAMLPSHLIKSLSDVFLNL